MSVRSHIESLDGSFESRVSAGRIAYQDIYNYLGRDLYAMDTAIYLCLCVFKADYNYSSTEISFVAQVTGNTGYPQSEWTRRIFPEVRSADYIERMLDKLATAPLEIKRSAVLLASLAAVIDHDVSYAESDEVQRLMRRIGTYFDY